MTKSSCDCSDGAKSIKKVTQTDSSLHPILRLIVVTLLALGILKLGLSFTEIGKNPLLSAIPSLPLVIISLLVVIIGKTFSGGTSLHPSHQLTTTQIDNIINSRDEQAELRIESKKMDYAKRLGESLKIKTVSYDYHDTENSIDYTEFVRLRKYIEDTYPVFHSKFKQTIINEYSLVYEWQGSDPSLKPYLLTAHTDVVPTPNPEQWTYDPFCGDIVYDKEMKDDVVYGRGAIDDKHNVFGYLEAFTDLIDTGFTPTRTIFVAFGHDEEISGVKGAAKIAEYFHKRLGNDCFEFMMDEGLFIIEESVPGHEKPVAYVCIAEKGAVTLRLSVNMTPGHASAPPSETAIGVLAQAVKRVEDHPMPAHIEGVAHDIFDWLKGGFNGPLKFVMNNLWLFAPIVKIIMTLKPLTAVIVRTTTALTVFRSGTKHNVLPAEAQAIINHRIHPGDNVQRVIDWDTKVINDPRVKIEVLESLEPAPVSDVNHPAFHDLVESVHATYKHSCAVAPGLFVANSDSKHYWNLAPQIFRFNPIVLHTKDVNMFHGFNERITVTNYAKLIYFYRDLILRSDKRHVQ